MARRAAVVVDLDLGFGEIIEEIQALNKHSLLVGIQEKTKTKYQPGRKKIQSPGINIANYAAENEFGTDKIPQRSFMRTSFDENIDQIEKLLSKEYGKVIDGQSTLKQALNIVGLAMTGLIQAKIRKITYPPNSTKTIAEKGSSKPLIDFGQMIASIRHVVKKKS